MYMLCEVVHVGLPSIVRDFYTLSEFYSTCIFFVQCIFKGRHCEILKY